MNGYEMSYCKYLEPEASSVLSLHVFSQFFHTFLALCAAFGLSPDGAHAKTIQTSEKHAQNRGKTPKIEPLGAPPGDRTLEELRAKARPSASRATRYALSICLFGKVWKGFEMLVRSFLSYIIDSNTVSFFWHRPDLSKPFKTFQIGGGPHLSNSFHL